jgi:murein DD-endopeptidase MepM/ murein hydrolase activator NlpD
MNSTDSSPEDSMKPKSIVGLNFRQIVDSLETQENIKEGNFYFVQDEFPNPVEKEIITITSRIKKLLNKLASRSFIVRFIIEVSIYIYKRFRLLFVLGSAGSEVFSNQLEVMKKFMIRKMFWGRGNLFRFSLQMLGALVLVVVLLAGGYRNGVVDAGFEFVEDPINYQHQLDMLVQNSSTKTNVSDNDYGRIEPEIYIVKGGDTLSSIASNMEINLETLLWANDMSSNSVIKPGMELNVPLADGVLIKVKKGDTVESLAKEYNTHAQAIIEWNWLDRPFILTSDQELFLPGGILPVEEQPSTVAAAPVYTGQVPKLPENNSPVTPTNNLGRFLGWPVAGGGSLSQCYSGWHNGIDIYSSAMPTLVSAAPGVVTFAGCQSGNCPPPGSSVGGSGLAWAVIIDHQNGYSTIYGHMHKITVSKGQKVAAGTPIGQMGQTGLAFGIHVHFMLTKTGSSVHINPAPYMSTHICGY